MIRGTAAQLAELYASGKPVVVEYALETPIETDISAHIPNSFIEVEGGGTLQFVNEYELDPPSTVTFQARTE